MFWDRLGPAEWPGGVGMEGREDTRSGVPRVGTPLKAELESVDYCRMGFTMLDFRWH